MSLRRALLLLVVALIPLCWLVPADPQLADVRRAFENPPDEARIMMRWWWFGSAVRHDELEREMRMMKDGGIGGFEVQAVYPLELDDATKGFRNLPFLSDEFVNALRFTSQKARELGLRADVTLGSGWPYGGPHVPITQAAGKLRVERAAVPADSRRVPLPQITAGEKLIAVYAGPGEARSVDARGLREITEIGSDAVQLPAGLDGRNVVLFFISSRTKQMVKRPAADADGFVLDHYDRAAIDNHLRVVADRLMRAFGPNPPKAVFSDSLEVYGSDWSSDFLAEFQKRRGYDLKPYLPALVGDLGEKTGAIRYDWMKTLTELCNERYLTPVREWSQRNKTLFRSQTYGLPPVTLSSNALVDLPEGEQPYWRRFTPSRWAASASHLYGKPVTSSETWTWLHSPAFRATPLDMKAEADLHFLQGINQLIGHGWPYSPASAGEPGWRFYAAAVFNHHNPWWMVMPDVTRYLQRTSYLLRLGKPANDVALYLPTADARAQAQLGRPSINEPMNQLFGPNLMPQILDAGYNLDFIDDEAIERVGIAHPIVVVPNVERMPLATLKRLEAFLAKGGVVIATRRLPSLAPGLMEAAKDTPEIQRLAQALFRGGKANAAFVEDEAQLGATLTRLFKPDMVTSPRTPEVGFIHRELPSASVYFMANTSNRQKKTEAAFRVKDMSPEWWDPFTGKSAPAVFTRSQGGVTVQLDLEPYGSRVLVFSKEVVAKNSASVQRTDLPAPIDLASNWKVTFEGLKRTTAMDKLRSWSDDQETRYFSGRAVYERTASVPATMLKPGARLVLDFGEGTVVEGGPSRNGMRAMLESPVREAAVVYVNGKRAGSVWRPPYEVEVTPLLKAGDNALRIEVGNLGINALAGQPRPDYRALNQRYGERFQPQDMDNLQPLPSGLLGPVRLVAR